MAADVHAVVAVGLNCSAPDGVCSPRPRPRGPGIAYPNSGQSWDAVARAWVGESAFDPALVRSWLDAGARLVGGCCRVGPADIAAFAADVRAGWSPLSGRSGPGFAGSTACLGTQTRGDRPPTPIRDCRRISPSTGEAHRPRGAAVPTAAARQGRGRRRARHVEVDDHGCMVTGQLLLARRAVDPRGGDASRHRRRGEDEVDAHAQILVEHAGPVVPVREDALGPAVPQHIGQPAAPNTPSAACSGGVTCVCPT